MTEERKKLYAVIDRIKRNREATTREERAGKYRKAWDALIEQLKVALDATVKAEYLGRPFICDDIEFYCLYTTTDELNKYIGRAASILADSELTGMLLDDGARMYDRLMSEQKALIRQGRRLSATAIADLKDHSRTYAAKAV